MVRTGTDARTVGEVMTPDPLVLETTSTAADAAKAMAGADIGDVPVIDRSGALCGIVTDRDIVVRVIAAGLDPTTTPVGDIASRDLVTLASSDTVDDAVEAMRDRALRRIPVVDDRRAVGIVSIGDLALDRDPESALADISGAQPNN